MRVEYAVMRYGWSVNYKRKWFNFVDILWYKHRIQKVFVGIKFKVKNLTFRVKSVETIFQIIIRLMPQTQIIKDKVLEPYAKKNN